jgi:hypothetical protein
VEITRSARTLRRATWPSFSVLVTAFAIALGGSMTASAVQTVGAPELGALELKIYPPNITPGGRAFVVVSNPSTETVADITLRWTSPPGVTIKVDGATSRAPGRIPSLPPGDTTVLNLQVRGVPSRDSLDMVFRANGRTGAQRVVAVAAASLAARKPLVDVKLSGGPSMTDVSPATLVALIQNLSPYRVNADVAVSAGRNKAGLSERANDEDLGTQTLCIQLAPLQIRRLYVTAKASGRVRKGTASIFVDVAAARAAHAAPNADCPAEPTLQTQYVTVSREVDVDMVASGVIPSILGVSSAAFLPGFAFVLGGLMVRRWDLGRVQRQSAGLWQDVWDNKLWLLVAALLSLVISFFAATLLDINLFDAFDWWDLGLLVAGSFVGGLLISAVEVAVHRSRVPLINEKSDPSAVAAAAVSNGRGTSAPTYLAVGDRRGLLVHRDRGLLLLTPQVHYSSPAEIVDAGTWREKKGYVEAREFDGKFIKNDEWIERVVAIPAANAAAGANEEVLIYREEDK